jgi:hypothetical protein
MRLVAASGYPLLNAFWTMLVFFMWVIWIWLLITVFADLFRRSDMSGWAKAGWTAFMLVLPFLGVLIYMIAQGKSMSERSVADAKAQQDAFDRHVRSVATTSNGHSKTAEIAQAKELLDNGAITATEFENLKQKALAS